MNKTSFKNIAFSLTCIIATACVVVAVSYEWPCESKKLELLFAGLGLVALVGTLVLQYWAIQDQGAALSLQQKQIDRQWREIQFNRISDLIDEPIKRYWSLVESQKSPPHDVMLLLVSRHLAGLAWAISFLQQGGLEIEAKTVLAHAYEPTFIKYATGNIDKLDEETKQSLSTVKSYYNILRG